MTPAHNTPAVLSGAGIAGETRGGMMSSVSEAVHDHEHAFCSMCDWTDDSDNTTRAAWRHHEDTDHRVYVTKTHMMVWYSE